VVAVFALLTSAQRSAREEYAVFADKEIVPLAAGFDAGQLISRDVVTALAAAGYLAAPVAERVGGGGMDHVSYGLLSEQIGRACQNLRNFVAVEDMVAQSIAMWGSAAQRERWVPEIRSGAVIAAFALTEPGVGSDAAAIEMTATRTPAGYRLRGRKKWISFGQLAELFLVFAKVDGLHTGFLVTRDNPGLTVRPMSGLLGLRGSMLAELVFDDCPIAGDDIIGMPGAGLAFVASSALDLGRYSTAWGSVGLAQACLDASVRHGEDRVQYGTPIADHQLIRRMLADMVTDVAAARLLCLQAGLSKQRGDAEAVDFTLMAKYRASTVATRVASDAVQVHGALGISEDMPVQRHYRDAKVMEIIEGTTQVHQQLLGDYARRLAHRR
jgi:alkylation response protein AidB-like acyl-CoA dehydrogenase